MVYDFLEAISIISPGFFLYWFNYMIELTKSGNESSNLLSLIKKYRDHIKINYPRLPNHTANLSFIGQPDQIDQSNGGDNSNNKDNKQDKNSGQSKSSKKGCGKYPYLYKGDPNNSKYTFEEYLYVNLAKCDSSW
jgi:hypothetical protein